MEFGKEILIVTVIPPGRLLGLVAHTITRTYRRYQIGKNAAIPYYYRVNVIILLCISAVVELVPVFNAG